MKILIAWIKHPVEMFKATQRRKRPVVNLDDMTKNCLVCGYDHNYKSKHNKHKYCKYTY